MVSAGIVSLNLHLSNRYTGKKGYNLQFMTSFVSLGDFLDFQLSYKYTRHIFIPTQRKFFTFTFTSILCTSAIHHSTSSRNSCNRQRRTTNKQIGVHPSIPHYPSSSLYTHTHKHTKANNYISTLDHTHTPIHTSYTSL